MAENENNEKSSFDYLQEKFADKPKVTEPTSPNAFDIKDLSDDEALEMYEIINIIENKGEDYGN